jgi:hypothetical protein
MRLGHLCAALFCAGHRPDASGQLRGGHASIMRYVGGAGAVHRRRAGLDGE